MFVSDIVCDILGLFPMQILHNGWLFDTDIRATLKALGPLSEETKQRLANEKRQKEWDYHLKCRRWRKRCHKVFDLVWQFGPLSRTDAYYWLERVTGERHIKDLNAEECQRVINLLKEQFPVCKD
jgi:hypothetical protein